MLGGTGGVPGLGRDGGGSGASSARDGGAGGGVSGGGAVGGAGGFGGSGRGGYGGRGGASAGVGGTTVSRGGSSGTIGGSTGRGGSPGVDPCILSPVPTNCGGSLCGNGVRDTCVIRAAFDTCPEVRFTEVCDGADFGPQSCQDFGYGGGTLTCSGFCQNVDVSSCNECGLLDGWLLRCGDGPVTITQSAMGIAATDSEVALAWVELDSANRPVLGFARLTPSLDVITISRVVDESLSLVWNLLVAPLPSGWVVAGYSEPEVFLHAFDADGQPVSRTTVDTLPGERLFSPPAVASRPNGGPLLVWLDDTTVRATIVAADGRSTTAPSDLSTDQTGGSAFSAAYVGDAFYVARAHDNLVDSQQLRLLRVEVDGKLAAAFDALPAVPMFDPWLVSGASDLRVVYTGQVAPASAGMDPVYSLLWQRVDPTGAPAAAPVVLPPKDPEFWGWSRGVAFGSDTAVLLFNANTPSSMAITRVASDGSIVTPPRKIAGGYTLASSWPVDFVRRGPDVVVLWMSPSGTMRLARVKL